MNIVIIGGSGFIGRRLVQLAIAAGHEVTVVARNASYSLATKSLTGGLDRLATEYEILVEADMFVHLASSTVPATANLSAASDIRDNLLGTINFLDALAELGPKRMIYLSSGGAVYGNVVADSILEDFPLRPIGSYGIVKAATEQYIELYARTRNLESAIVRPSNPYGPGQISMSQGLVGAILRSTISGRSLPVFGNGQNVRDYIYIDDLCNFLLLLISNFSTGVFNCGSGKGHSIVDILALCAEITGQEIAIDWKPARPFDPQKVVLDASRAQRLTGWMPTISLPEGIRRTWQEIRNQQC